MVSWQHAKSSLFYDLLFCRLCCDTLKDDARCLPCQHSFCTDCLQSHIGADVADTLTCPTCFHTVELPPEKVAGFPVDTRLQMLKKFLDQSENRINHTSENSDGSGRRNEDKIIDSKTSSPIIESHCDNEKSTPLEKNCHSAAFCHQNKPASTSVIQTTQAHEPGNLFNGYQHNAEPLQFSSKCNVVLSSTSAVPSSRFDSGQKRIEVLHNDLIKQPCYPIFSGIMSCESKEVMLKSELSTNPNSSEALELTDYRLLELQVQFHLRTQLKWCVTSRFSEKPTSLAFMSTGHLAVALHGDDIVSIYDDEGKLKQLIDNVTPFSVAVDEKKKLLLVGDRKDSTLKTYNFDGKLVTHFQTDSISWISGIAVVNDCYVIIDRSSCTAVIVNNEGDLQLEFGHTFDQSGEVIESLTMADYLCVDSQNRILISDSGNHCVKVFDTDGRMLQKISGRGHEDGLCEWPKGVCVDDKDNVYIADNGNGRVSVFDRDGRFISHLLQCKNPVDIAFLPPNLFALTQFSSNGCSQVSVFVMEATI